MSRLDRQSFLGADSDSMLHEAAIGIVGLGGGGSHEVQQFAHAGIGRYVIVDPDIIDETNTNRLVGGTLADVAATRAKVDIAVRLIRGLQPHAGIVPFKGPWRDATHHLKTCDVILGAVDSYVEREQLERFARRNLIPYIDVGMDVHALDKGGFLISGQVFLSSPGAPCLRCCGIVTDERLRLEAAKYGAAGGRPQVVWSNGVLASTATGLAIRLLTPWHRPTPAFTYLEYDGNRGTLVESTRVALLKDRVCSHHPPSETGDPLFDIRAYLADQAKAPAPAPAVMTGSVIRPGLFRRLRAWFGRLG